MRSSAAFSKLSAKTTRHTQVRRFEASLPAMQHLLRARMNPSPRQASPLSHRRSECPGVVVFSADVSSAFGTTMRALALAVSRSAARYLPLAMRPDWSFLLSSACPQGLCALLRVPANAQLIGQPTHTPRVRTMPAVAQTHIRVECLQSAGTRRQAEKSKHRKPDASSLQGRWTATLSLSWGARTSRAKRRNTSPILPDRVQMLSYSRRMPARATQATGAVPVGRQ